MENKPTIGLTSVSQAAAIATVALYVIGFVVVNSNLAKWGITSFNFANAQFLAAGIQFAVFSGIFGFLVGRRLYYFNHDVAEFSKLGQSYRWPNLWSAFCLIQVLTEAAFSIIVAANWTSAIFFARTSEQNGLTIVLIFFFVVDYYFLTVIDLYKKRPHVALPIAFLFHLGVIITALWIYPDASISLIASIYLVMSLVTGFMIDIDQRRYINFIYRLFSYTIFILVFAATFGSAVFDHIKSSVGGGEVHNVELIFRASVSEALLKRLIAVPTEPVHLQMITETPDSIYVIDPKQTGSVVRIAKDEVAAISSEKSALSKNDNKPLH